jgi:hypothetical protein
MSNWLAQIIVGFVTAYTFIGVLFALWLIAFGLGRLDAAAQHAGWGLRLLLLPGAAAFWPWLAWRSSLVRQ